MKHLVLAAAFAVTTSAAVAQGRPDVPIIIEETDTGACSNGVVVGLDPHGDGFLAVKAGPSIHYRRIDRLFNGQELNICGSTGPWLAIVYSKRGQECNVNGPWQRTLPYTGPCLSGWVHRRWVEATAG
jgi:hypothetical protein